MKLSGARLAASLALLLLALPSCKSNSDRYNHWTVGNIAPRTVRHLTRHDPESGDDYRETAKSQRNDIFLTVRRHALNSNPANPFQNRDPWYPPDHRVMSPLPNPVYYVIDPIGAVLSFLEPGGPSEFVDGIQLTFTGKSRLDRQPPSPDEFRVRNP